MQSTIDFLTGREVMAKWGIEEPLDLLYLMIYQGLPIRTDSFGNKMHWDKDDMGFFFKPERTSEIADELFPLDEVNALDKKYGENIPDPKDLITGKKLMEAWGRKENYLLSMIDDYGLKMVDRFGQTINDNYYGLIRNDSDRVAEQLFLLKDVEAFEKEHPDVSIKPIPVKEKKLRANQRHRLACREVAEKLWDEDPTITIADMAHEDDITNACDGKVYAERTIRKWVKDLCPDNSPGRRPKKKIQ